MHFVACLVNLSISQTNEEHCLISKCRFLGSAPQVTDVQVVLVDDRPDLNNPTNFPDSMASIVTYAVLGNTPLPVDALSAKENFRKLISATRIPVIPVNLTDTIDSFAFLESLGLDYHTMTERDVLLQQVKVIWQQLLGQ